jgi:hypothetical protein
MQTKKNHLMQTKKNHLIQTKKNHLMQTKKIQNFLNPLSKLRNPVKLPKMTVQKVRAIKKNVKEKIKKAKMWRYQTQPAMEIKEEDCKV